MNPMVKKLLSLLLSVVLVLPLYILLHECGHLIVMLFAGATITDFSILHAHVSGVDGSYTNLSDLWLHANGAFLPVLASFVYGFFYQKDREGIFYRVFSYFVVLVPIASLLAWIFIPFLFMQGKAPAGDDVTLFLANFSQSHSPILVSISAAILMGIGIMILVRKRILWNFKRAVQKTD